MHTKADPSVAIMEAEPAVLQANEKFNLGSLRAMQHKDVQGNPIVEPDRSNPTRSRWERPLDTIRSFEAAIDGNYRKTYSRADSSESNWNRRGSYYAGGANDERPRGSQNGYYGNGNRAQSYRESGYYNGNGNGRPDSYYYNGQDYNGQNQNQNPNRSRYPRTTSEPYGNVQGVYPATGNQQSYETVTSALGSGSSGEPAGYVTDPSSENSSLDRGQAIQNKQQPVNNYGFEGFGGNPQLQPVGAGINANPYNNYNQNQNPGGSVLRKQAPGGGPIKLGGAPNSNETSVYTPPRPEPEKKKGFFKRFSRSS